MSTPFMLAVEHRLLGESAADPSTEDAHLQPIAVATDSQVMIRALAEQLVSEANSVLHPYGDTISLLDHCGPGQLSFTLGYADRQIRIEMFADGGAGTSRIVTTADASQRLSSAAEVAPLILALIEPAASR